MLYGLLILEQMPYIKQEQREKLNSAIDELSDRIVSMVKSEDDSAFAGILNYVSTRLALSIIRKKFGKIRYWMIAVITGVFKNVADEFYRRLAVPYEDKKIDEEGDVDLYEDLLKDIKK